MEVKINKEIRNYTESMFFGLSMRQFIFSALACIVAVGLYFMLKPYVGTETVSWLCIAKAKVDFDVAKTFEVIKENVNHKEFQQDYFLKNYYLSYVALAYIYCNKLDDPYLLSILSAFAEEISQGEILDRGGLSMVGETFAQFLEHRSNMPSIIDRLLRINQLENLEAENKELNNRINEFSDTIDGYRNKAKFKKIFLKVLKWIVVTVLVALITVFVEFLFPLLFER